MKKDQNIQEKIIKEEIIKKEIAENRMVRERILIHGIPAVLWGPPSDRCFLFIHGQGGCKEEAERFAETAVQHAWQVLSTDLPGHGERLREAELLVPWHVMEELQTVRNDMSMRWHRLALYAGSIGAWFSLLAFQEENFYPCLFLSPLLNMEQFIMNEMKQNSITEQQLQIQREICTASGRVLSWEYLDFVRKHPVQNWKAAAQILAGEQDALTAQSDFQLFARLHHGSLTVMPGGEHWFHTPEQLAFLSGWEKENLCLYDAVQ